MDSVSTDPVLSSKSGCDLVEKVTSKHNTFLSMGQRLNEERTVQILVEAGELLRALSPKPLATLFLIDKYDEINQDEIASRVQCGRSTVSKYLQNLSDLTTNLVKKSGRQYVTTDDGKYVLDLIRELASKNDIELEDRDWSSDEVRQMYDDLLTPLHDSRSATPFFVLYVLNEETTDADYTNEPKEVSLNQIFKKINTYQRKRGEGITTQQLRQILRRFEDAKSVDFDGKEIQLTSKGKSQAYLLKKIVALVAKRYSSHIGLSEHREKVEETVNQSDTIVGHLNERSNIDNLLLGNIEDQYQINHENVEIITEELRRALQRTNISIFELETAIYNLKREVDNVQD